MISDGQTSDTLYLNPNPNPEPWDFIINIFQNFVFTYFEQEYATIDFQPTCNGDISESKNNANIQCWSLTLLYPKGILKVDSCIGIVVLV